MTDEQIKHMVNRFLGWSLPENFTPDAGISFKRTFNENTPHPMQHRPVGTNLFDAMQATEMVKYMLDGLPEGAVASPTERDSLRDRCKNFVSQQMRRSIMRVGDPVQELMEFVIAETGKLAAPELGETSPLCLYFGSDAERDDFITMVQQVTPAMTARKVL